MVSELHAEDRIHGLLINRMNLNQTFTPNYMPQKDFSEIEYMSSVCKEDEVILVI